MVNFTPGPFGSTPLRVGLASAEPPPVTQAHVKITRVIRLMYGGSQAQLVKGNDGNFYATEFLGNPQGNRTLINEWIACRLLSDMGIISMPSLRILELPSTLLPHADLYFLVGSKRIPPQGVLHLGSQCPVDPEKTAIFDFLPDKLLPTACNLAEFAAMTCSTNGSAKPTNGKQFLCVIGR